MAKMTKLALRFIFESCVTNDIRYFTGYDDDYARPLLTPADLNRAKFVQFGNDIRVIEII